MSARTPEVNVFQRTVAMVVERHYPGIHRKASMSAVTIEKDASYRDVDKALLSLTKRLINSSEVRAVDACDRRFRDYLLAKTTPFRESIFLVAFGQFEPVDAAAQAWLAERIELADAAAAAYPAHVEAMREPLGVLYDEHDYRSVERFRAAYWADYRFLDFGVPNVVAELSRDTFVREKESLRRMGEDARQRIQQHLRGTLLEITTRLAEMLRPKENGKRPALRDGALDGLLGYLNDFAVLNVVGDASLGSVVGRLQQMASGLYVPLLRSDDDLRVQTAQVMAEVREALVPLVEERARGIRFRDQD